MKTLVVLAAAGLALASVAAYAQMHHGPGGASRQEMQERMQEKMKGPHSGTGHGGMGHGMNHGGGAGHGGHGSHAATAPKGDAGPASQAFRAINDRMHRAMDVAFTGNADVDFVAGMIPHHEGAVEMAKVVLAFGKDPEIRKLAEEIVRAQESEIALMKAWLERNKSNKK